MPDDAYAFWRDSAARDHLRGPGLDLGEPWDCSEVTRDDLPIAGRIIALRRDDGVAATTYRTRTYEREGDGDGSQVWAEYGAAAWRDLDACRAPFGAITADAAAVGADRTRVLVPETARHVSGAARAGAELSGEPDLVFGTDPTGR